MTRKTRRGNQISWHEYVLNHSGTGDGGIRNFQNKLSVWAERGVPRFPKRFKLNASCHNAMTLQLRAVFIGFGGIKPGFAA